MGLITVLSYLQKDDLVASTLHYHQFDLKCHQMRTRRFLLRVVGVSLGVSAGTGADFDTWLPTSSSGRAQTGSALGASAGPCEELMSGHGAGRLKSPKQPNEPSNVVSIIDPQFTLP